jgi:hypothetical protein
MWALLAFLETPPFSHQWMPWWTGGVSRKASNAHVSINNKHCIAPPMALATTDLLITYIPELSDLVLLLHLALSLSRSVLLRLHPPLLLPVSKVLVIYGCMYVCMLCMYVCVYVCMYVCCMHVSMYMHVCMYVCMYVWICECMNVWHACMHVIHVCTWVCL